MFAKKLSKNDHKDYLMKSITTFPTNLMHIEYKEELGNIRPIGRMKLEAVSLVVKYSPDFPNMLIIPDGNGNIYMVNCLRTFDKKLPQLPNIAEIQPERKCL